MWFTQAQLQNNATESSEAELALHAEVRGLRSELDEAKRKASRLNQEHRELCQHLEDSEKDKETLRQAISQLEDTKRQQERALEKLGKEVRRIDRLYTCTNDKSVCRCLSSLLTGEHAAQKKSFCFCSVLFVFRPPVSMSL